MTNIKYCKKYKDTHYYLPIFGCNINIVFNQEDFIYLCRKYHDFEFNRPISNNGETLLDTLTKEVVIGIFNNSYSTIVHELVHTVLFILEEQCMNPNDSNGEAMAYIQAHLFDIVVDRMEKYNAKH